MIRLFVPDALDKDRLVRPAPEQATEDEEPSDQDA